MLVITYGPITSGASCTSIYSIFFSLHVKSHVNKGAARKRAFLVRVLLRVRLCISKHTGCLPVIASSNETGGRLIEIDPSRRYEFNTATQFVIGDCEHFLTES